MGVMAGITGKLLFIRVFGMFTKAAISFNGIACVIVCISIIPMAVETDFIRRHSACITALNIIFPQNVVVQ